MSEAAQLVCIRGGSWMKMKTKFFIYFLELENWDRALAHFLSNDDGAAQNEGIFFSYFFLHLFYDCVRIYIVYGQNISYSRPFFHVVDNFF